MRRATLVLAPAAALALLAGCQSRDEGHASDALDRVPGQTTDSGGRAVAAEREVERAGDVAIVSRAGEVRLALEGDTVAMRLSDSVLATVRSSLAERTAGGGVGGRIEDVVKSTVSKALAQRIAYHLDDIEDARYEGGAIRFRLRDRNVLSFDDVKLKDNKPALESFAPADAERFVAAVRARKGLP